MQLRAISGIILVVAMLATPAAARRRAVDQSGDLPLYYFLGGYCDLDGEECGGSDLGYTVRLGNGAAVDRVIVYGNGQLSFGNASVLDTVLDDQTDSIGTKLIYAANGGDEFTPTLTDYGQNLVSVGQNNTLVGKQDAFFGAEVFYQSAKLSFGAGGKITAEWFTCFAPTSTNFCPSLDRQFLTLTPTTKGFSAVMTGAIFPSDQGYVIDGLETSVLVGQRFLIPAEFTGVDFAANVPEPASWAMMIAGFGLTGACLRRRRAALAH